eukprot:1789345-Prymnesium_polylepis.1
MSRFIASGYRGGCFYPRVCVSAVSCVQGHAPPSPARPIICLRASTKAGVLSFSLSSLRARAQYNVRDAAPAGRSGPAAAATPLWRHGVAAARAVWPSERCGSSARDVSHRRHGDQRDAAAGHPGTAARGQE